MSSSSSSGLFESATTTPAFGQAQASHGSSGFGTNFQGNTCQCGSRLNAFFTPFLSETTSAFGVNKPAFGCPFGTNKTNSPFSFHREKVEPVFKQAIPLTGNNLFGSSTGIFGSAIQPTGSTIKFTPVTGTDTDTIMQSGVSQPVNIRYFSISCMKEYEKKSFDEIRLEDYLTNGKGPQTKNVFGATGNLFESGQTGNQSLFGNTNTNFGCHSTNNIFGTAPSTSNSSFNKTTPFGTKTTSGFDFKAPAWNNNLFGGLNSNPFISTDGLFNFEGTANPPPRRTLKIHHRRCKSLEPTPKEDLSKNSQIPSYEFRDFRMDMILKKLEEMDQKNENFKDEILNTIKNNSQTETKILETSNSTNPDDLQKLKDNFNKVLNLQNEKIKMLEEKLEYLEGKEEQRREYEIKHTNCKEKKI